MRKTIYIFSDGALKRKDNTLYFETDRVRKYIPVENTSELMVFGEVTVNKRFLEFLTQTEIIMHLFNRYGYYVGSFYPREHLNSGYMILHQAEHYLAEEKRLNIARAFVDGAVKNIIKVLSYYQNRGIDLKAITSMIENISQGIQNALSNEELMATEGNIREQYYKAFDLILNNEHFVFEARTKRPPHNRLNALISFGNTLLYTTVLSEIYQTHLDPRIGFLHSTNFRRFTLNLDVAEIFKPIVVDRIIFKLVNKGIIKAKHFEERLGGIVLNEKGRELFVKEFDERLKTTIRHRGLGRNVSYRRLIRMELYKIEKHLMGDEEYKPFVAYW